MRYALFGNGRVALTILRWLADRGEPPVALVVHPEARSRHRADIIAASGLPPSDVLDAPALREREGVEWLRARQPDWLFSLYFAYVLHQPVLDTVATAALNMHPALLPLNKGAYPNVWAIIDGTPAGVTLHYMNDQLDGGDIAAQREVPVLPADTGASLYARLEDAAIQLFMDCWPMITAGTLPRFPQQGGGTFHRFADVERVDRIDPDAMFRAGDLIDVLRARTFPPYRGAYLDFGERRLYVQLQLDEDSSCD